MSSQLEIPGDGGGGAPALPGWLVTLFESAVTWGHIEVVHPVLGWLTRPAAIGCEPAPDDAGVEAVLAAMAHAVASLTGRPEPSLSLPLPGPADPIGNDLQLALPLLRVVVGARGRAGVVDLPVPALGGAHRELWRVARDVLEAEVTGTVPGGAPLAHRSLFLDAALLDSCPPEVRPAWILAAARFGWLTGDAEICAVAGELLWPVRDQFALLGRLLPIGPAGWFLADVEHVLGHDAEARAANALAEQVSRRAGARAWTARCRLQRERLARPWAAPGGPREPAPPAPAAGTVPAPSGGAGRAGDAGRTGDAGRAGDAVALTSRQRDILDLAARGLTNVQIAQQLHLSVATVERHCTLAYRALGVRNRAQALGLLSPRGAGARGDPVSGPGPGPGSPPVPAGDRTGPPGR